MATTHESPAAALPRGNKRVLIAFAIGGLLLLVVVALLGGWAYLTFSGHNMAGLDGTWRDLKNPGHAYEFHRSGRVDTWSGGHKSWWNKIGWSATWHRDGQQITIRTDRNWDFVGRLDGASIRGEDVDPRRERRDRDHAGRDVAKGIAGCGRRNPSAIADVRKTGRLDTFLCSFMEKKSWPTSRRCEPRSPV
jgi:hypothetical protein